MIESVQAIVVRTEDLGEADKRLTLYTRELGKLNAKVVGVKKTASKLRVLTLPFSESRFQVYLHGTKRAGLRDPGKVVGGAALDFHSPLRSDWDRMIQAATLCETLDALTHPFFSNPKEYDLLTGALCSMEQTPSPKLVRLRTTLILLKLLGYSLRHHALWNSYSDREQSLLHHLGTWQEREDEFSKQDEERLETIVDGYLGHYLPRPLKTTVFQKKIDATAETAGDWSAAS